MATMHKGVHDRGYLPHWDFEDSVQAITFRLGDAVPKRVIEDWRDELADGVDKHGRSLSARSQTELHRRISRYEDAGYGSCVLGLSGCAQVIQDLLLTGHGKSYELFQWCIMPNHVHVLVRLDGGTSLGRVVKGWKAPAAIGINKLLGRSGSLWQVDYHDRFIRDQDHFHNAVAYIRENPVKAGLCKHAGDWKFSSAGMGWGTGENPQEGRTRAE